VPASGRAVRPLASGSRMARMSHADPGKEPVMKRPDLGRVDPAWTVTLDADARLERVAEALCSLADGRFGTRGSREEDGAGSTPLVLAAGVYHEAGDGPTLLPGPGWRRRPPPAKTAASWTCTAGCCGEPGGPATTPPCAACGSPPWPVPGWSACGPRDRPVSCAPARRCWLPGTGSASRRAAAATSSGPALGPPAGVASPPPPASAPATIGPGWSAWPSSWPTRTAPRPLRRPWSGCVRWRWSGSTAAGRAPRRLGGQVGRRRGRHPG
jgi:hypothetical protein